jgi:hypothetical protein
VRVAASVEVEHTAPCCSPAVSQFVWPRRLDWRIKEMFSSILKFQRQASLNVTTQSSAASRWLCTCGIYRLKLLQNDRQFPDPSVIYWIVEIRCKTDQAHYAALVGRIALCFY